MSSAVQESLSLDDVVERARGLVPSLRANAEKTEQANQALPETVAALRDAGLWRIPTPAVWGGYGDYGLGLRAEAAVAAELARGCPSTGWVMMVSNAGRGFLQGIFSEEVSTEIYTADPDVSIAIAGAVGGVAAKVDGGYRFTGQIPYASGCTHSAYTIALTSAVTVNGEYQMAVATVLVPTADAEIKYTWDVAGLRGTGSNTVVCEDLFIPDRFVAYHPLDANGAPEGMGTATHTLASNVLAPLVGAAQGALDTITELFAKGKPIHYTTYGTVADSPGARAWLADATHHVDTAWQHLWATIDALEPALAEHIELPDAERTKIRMHLAASVREARAGLAKVMDLGGAAGFASANPLQRYFRDFETGSRHWSLNPFIAQEDRGKALLGQGPLASIAV